SDILHVRAGLGEDMVQVVAEANESEPLVEKLADSRSAKKEEAEDDVVLAGFGDQFVSGGAKFGRSKHVREFVFFVEAHGHAEIVLAEEKNVDAGNSGDFCHVLDAVGSFDL